MDNVLGARYKMQVFDMSLWGMGNLWVQDCATKWFGAGVARNAM